MKIDQSTQTTTRKTYSSRCTKCGQRLLGFSVSMLKYNMKVHLKQKHNYEGIEEVKK